jgi:hypothetical protein
MPLICLGLPSTMPKDAPGRSTRGWWRDHFLDHPKYASKDPVALIGKDKTKVYCIKCFDSDIASLGQEYGAREIERDRVQLEDECELISYCLTFYEC